MAPLTPRQETFCQAYAVQPNGAAAARAAGYKASHAANQGSRLLKRPEIAERIAALAAGAADREAALAATRADAARRLVEELAPVQQAHLEDGDYDGVTQLVELKGHLEGLLTGGAIVKPRGPRPAPRPRPPGPEDRDALEEAKKAFEITACLASDVRQLRSAVEDLAEAAERMAEVVDPDNKRHLLDRYRTVATEYEEEGGYFIDALDAENEAAERGDAPANADAEAEECL